MLHPRRLRHAPAAHGAARGKFVTAVVHQQVAPDAGAAALAARLADELPPRRLLVASFDRPLWQRALGLDGLAQAAEPLPVWWPDDQLYWATPDAPPIAGALADRHLEAEHVWSGLGWRATLHLVAWRHRDAELVLAICPPDLRVPALGGRTEAVHVPAP